MALYGICNLSCQIQIFPNFLDINVELSSGILVEIVDTQTEKYGIRIPKLSNTTIQQSDFYLCPKDKLIIISEDVVPFLMAITDLNHRVCLARRLPQIEFIRALKVGHIAAVYGTLFHERKYFECRVKYIGPVAELGPGSFIGVEFLHGEEKPQHSIPLTIIEKYVKCTGYKGVITTANWLISIQNYRKMNINKSTGIQLPTSVPSLSNADPLMNSFMEKFSQFLSTNNNQTQFIGNSMTSSNSIFSEDFLQKANEFYTQKSMNKSLSSSQTSLNSSHENDSNKNFNHNRNTSRRNSGNIPSLMDLPIAENVFLENRSERQNVVSPRQRQDQDQHHHRQQDYHQRADHQPRQRPNPEEAKYNNQWNGRKFIILNSVYKTRCSFCANVKELCEFKKADVAEIVPFQNQFRCRKCYRMHDRTDMIVVKRCFHVFGKKCLAASVNNSDGGPVHCPAKLKTVCHTIFSEDDLMLFLTNEEKVQYTDKQILHDFKTSINFDNLDNTNEIPLIQQNSNEINETEMNLEISNDESAIVEDLKYHLIPNFDEFTCPLCLKFIPERKGVSLQQCFHNFCKECLSVKIQINKEARVKCPFQESPCEEYLLDTEIKMLVSTEVYDLHLNKSIYQFSVDNGETISFEDYVESLKPVLGIGNSIIDVVSPESLLSVAAGSTSDNLLENCWVCTLCGQKNAEKVINCTACTFKNQNLLTHTLKPNQEEEMIADLQLVESGSTQDILLENSWDCPFCLQENSENVINCTSCTRPLKRLQEEANASETNDEAMLLEKNWDCPLCEEKNTENELYCKKCTLKNPDSPINQWMCEVCLNETNVSKTICDFCTSARPVPVFPTEVIEKWICQTCGDENKETQKCCRFCLVERPKPVAVVDRPSEYEELLTLEEGDLDLVENFDVFECPICIVVYEKGEGVMLRECLHVFCKECLAGTINMSDSPEIKCPYMSDEYTCDCFVQDREIRAAITKEDYENYLTKSLNLAEKVIKDSYHCLTVDCKGWWVNEEEVNLIVCPVCEIENCLNCNTIHTNLTCKQYQDKLFNAPDAQAQRTKEMIEVLLRDGSAIKCPNCGIIIQRSEGCDWLRCSCMTEICWATKGARWGPRGLGDTSGGCRCKVNGKLCTPTCRNCH